MDNTINQQLKQYYGEHHRYLIERCDMTLNHLENIMKYKRNQNQTKKMRDSHLKEHTKVLYQYLLNDEVSKLKQDIIEIRQIVKKIFHILGYYTLTPEGLPLISLNEYYGIQDVFIRCELFCMSCENYPPGKIVFAGIDILKHLQSIYKQAFNEEDDDDDSTTQSQELFSQ